MNRLQWIVVVVSIILILIFGHRYYQKKSKILRDYEFTTGKIIEYYRVGTSSHKLVYLYEVDGEKYSRRIDSWVWFKNCENDLSLCSNKVFWVIYSEEDPTLSLIDLEHQIQNLENVNQPKSIESFK